MTIELRDLRWFIAISQHRSLRQTAETLNIRQATLSQRMRYVEYKAEAKLFVRTNGGTRLTEAGLEFLEAAQRIVAESDAAIERLKFRSRGENSRLRIGIYASLATGNMHAIIAEHHRRFPDVDALTLHGTHDQLLWALSANIIDIAIMTVCRSHWGVARSIFGVSRHQMPTPTTITIEQKERNNVLKFTFARSASARQITGFVMPVIYIHAGAFEKIQCMSAVGTHIFLTRQRSTYRRCLSIG